MKTSKIRKEKRRMWIVILSILGTIGVTMGVGILVTAPGRQELMDVNIAALDFKNCVMAHT